MKVLGLGWLGIRVEAFSTMRRFMSDVLGLEVEFESEDFAILRSAGGDNVELFGLHGPQTREQFSAAPIVAGFLVEDIEAARKRLVAARIELLGPLNRAENGYAWQHFRGPDGLVYELCYDPRRKSY